jgi:hypothetical protein
VRTRKRGHEASDRGRGGAEGQYLEGGDGLDVRGIILGSISLVKKHGMAGSWTLQKQE